MTSFTRRRLFWILLLTPYFKPAVFGVMEGTELLETVFDGWRAAAAVVIVGLYLYGLLRQRQKPSWMLLLLGTYLGVVAVSTALHGRNYWDVLNHCLTIVTFCMLLELSLRQGADYTMDMLFFPLTVLILSNFILIAIFPKGLCIGGNYNYSYTLMGIDNFLGPILVPYMVLTALRSTMKHGDLDIWTYALIGIAALSLLLSWTVTAILGMAVALVFLLFFYQRRLQWLFNSATAMLVSFGMFFAIVLFRLQDVFAFFIEGVLHKGLSFTGRTEIWDLAIDLIMASPLIGYGFAQRGKIYRIAKGRYYHAHNVYLELMMEGGVLGTLPFVGMMALSGHRLMAYRKHPYACLISAGLMACWVMTTMEPYLDQNGLLIYGLMFLGYHIEALTQGKYPEEPGSTELEEA